jgi:hypothetical protein
MRRRYNEGCRCADCTEANRVYFRHRRAAKAQAPVAVVTTPPAAEAYQLCDPGPVERGVAAEIAGVTKAGPELAAAALALARIVDGRKAVSSLPAAAKVLIGLLDKLEASAPARRGISKQFELPAGSP